MHCCQTINYTYSEKERKHIILQNFCEQCLPDNENENSMADYSNEVTDLWFNVTTALHSVSDIKRGGRGRGGMSPEQPLPSEAFIASYMKSSTVVCNAIFNS